MCVLFSDRENSFRFSYILPHCQYTEAKKRITYSKEKGFQHTKRFEEAKQQQAVTTVRDWQESRIKREKGIKQEKNNKKTK